MEVDIRIKGKNFKLAMLLIIVIAIIFVAVVDNAYGATVGTVSDKAGLNVRSGPGTEYSILKVLSYGESFSIVSTEKDNKGQAWYKIISNGTSGYVISTYVEVQ